MFFRRLELILRCYPEQVDRVITKFGLNITVTDFKEWIVKLRIDYRNYIKLNVVKGIMVGGKDDEFSMVLRVIFKGFLDNTAR